MKMIIHIGARKTGTTTVQSMLKSNVDGLRARGLFTTTAYDAEADNIFTNRFLFKMDVTAKWDGWMSRLEAARREGADRALISAESLTDLHPQEIETLRDFLAPVCDEVAVLFYVRRQDIVAVSHYSTGLRGGGTSEALMSQGMGPRRLRGFRYKKTADAWANVFGAEALTVRVFPDPKPKSWDIMDDILPYLDIDRADLVKPGDASANPRLSARQAAYLRQLNLRLGPAAKAKGPRLQRDFLAQNPDLAEGPSVPLPSRASAEAFYNQFCNGNENLRRTYLPAAEGPLFPKNFDRYPEEASPLEDHLDMQDFETRLEAFL